MSQKVAKKAAKWWADQLRGYAKLDHGDKSPHGEMTFMLASLLQSEEKAKQTPEQIDLFEQNLTDIILEKINKNKEINMPIWIECDYEPDHTLCDAAEVSNLKLGRVTLPWKTVMKIKNNSVCVSCGYGAQYVEI